MTDFVSLCDYLSTTLDEDDVTEKLAAYFTCISKHEVAITIQILQRKYPEKICSAKQLANWAKDIASIPDWLYEESKMVTKDLSELAALLLPNNGKKNELLLTDVFQKSMDAKRISDEALEEFVLDFWKNADTSTRYIFNKLITNTLLLPIQPIIVFRALQIAFAWPSAYLAVLFNSKKFSYEITFESIAFEISSATTSISYPFFHHQIKHFTIDDCNRLLGQCSDYYIERDIPGIKVQIIRQEKNLYIWTKDQKLITDYLPELQDFGLGENFAIEAILVCKVADHYLSKKQLNEKIAKKNFVQRKRDLEPIKVFMYDILSMASNTVSHMTLENRKELLKQIPIHEFMEVSSDVKCSSWDDANLLLMGKKDKLPLESLIIRPRDSNSASSIMYKMSKPPIVLAVVLLYAHRNDNYLPHLFSEFTFGIRDSDVYLPLVKIALEESSGHLERLNSFTKENKLERFGSTTSLKPFLMTTISIHSITRNARKKCGYEAGYAQIVAIDWNKDLQLENIASKEELRKFL